MREAEADLNPFCSILTESGIGLRPAPAISSEMDMESEQRHRNGAISQSCGTPGEPVDTPPPSAMALP